jgi:hypothetical protein
MRGCACPSWTEGRRSSCGDLHTERVAVKRWRRRVVEKGKMARVRTSLDCNVLAVLQRWMVCVFLDDLGRDGLGTLQSRLGGQDSEITIYTDLFCSGVL